MGKAIVVFGPAEGNAEALAEYVANGLEKGGVDVTLKNVIDANMDELVEYDTIVLFCSTKAVKEQHDSTIDLHADLNDILLAGKKSRKSRSKGSDQYPEILSEKVIIGSAA